MGKVPGIDEVSGHWGEEEGEDEGVGFFTMWNGALGWKVK